MKIDINCDLGEGAGNDLLIMPHITSANIACGGHAGSLDTMKDTVLLAIRHGVKIGAHPGYPDPANFGRISLNLSGNDLLHSVVQQITLLKQLAEELGGRLVHVKPHGALYNDAAKDPVIAAIIADAVYSIDPNLVLVGLAGSVMLEVAEKLGLKVAREVFADRTYTDEGQLVPRSEPGALITDVNQSTDQVSMMVRQGKVQTRSGKLISIQADTICIHGDGPLAVDLAKALDSMDFRSTTQLVAMFESSSELEILPLGDTAFLVRFGETISPEINRQVHKMADLLKTGGIPGFVEVVPGYSDLLVIYQPRLTDRSGLLRAIKAFGNRLFEEIIDTVDSVPEILEVPIVYGDEYGPDLKEVALHAGLTEHEVIRRHLAGNYTVFMMGFTPGFCYLGGLDPSLNTPRKQEPRLKVPAGSVGIAGNQTGIYPIESPGGWQIIGRTPLKLFDPAKENPFLCKAGLTIRFIPLSTFHPSSPETRNPKPETLLSQLPSPYTQNLIPCTSPPTPFIRVLAPGLLTTIQDAGRTGFRVFGMPSGGAMDLPSMNLANKLVGNSADKAVLEITFVGPVLEFHGDTIIAITGANLRPALNGAETGMGMAIAVCSGDQLTFVGLLSGLRAYLAVAGGIDVPEIMGSRSTYLRGGIGGFQGRAVQAGDEIPIGIPVETDLDLTRPTSPENLAVKNGNLAETKKNLQEADQDQPVRNVSSVIIHFVAGPETGKFSPNGLKTFLESEYVMSSRSDRMGIRLDGPTVEHLENADILSSGVIPGTIQVPGDGKPIILMNDCQTTGGYTRIGCAIQEDLRLLAQLKPGDKIRFREVSL